MDVRNWWGLVFFVENRCFLRTDGLLMVDDEQHYIFFYALMYVMYVIKDMMYYSTGWRMKFTLHCFTKWQNTILTTTMSEKFALLSEIELMDQSQSISVSIENTSALSSRESSTISKSCTIQCVQKNKDSALIIHESSLTTLPPHYHKPWQTPEITLSQYQQLHRVSYFKSVSDRDCTLSYDSI